MNYLSIGLFLSLVSSNIANNFSEKSSTDQKSSNLKDTPFEPTKDLPINNTKTTVYKNATMLTPMTTTTMTTTKSTITTNPTPNTISTLPHTSPNPITTTAESSTKPQNFDPTQIPSKSRHFDGLSFMGGIILTACIVGLSIGFYKFYKIKIEQSYVTL